GLLLGAALGFAVGLGFRRGARVGFRFHACFGLGKRARGLFSLGERFLARGFRRARECLGFGLYLFLGLPDGARFGRDARFGFGFRAGFGFGLGGGRRFRHGFCLHDCFLGG